jgi:hypothetical protein
MVPAVSLGAEDDDEFDDDELDDDEFDEPEDDEVAESDADVCASAEEPSSVSTPNARPRTTARLA